MTLCSNGVLMLLQDVGVRQIVFNAALAFGSALSQALGDRKGIHRFGDFSAPLDEALVHVVLVGSIYACHVHTVGTLSCWHCAANC